MRQFPSSNRISDSNPGSVGRHRRPIERIWRPTRETLRRAIRSRTAFAGSALTCVALAALAGQPAMVDHNPSTATAAKAGEAGVVEQMLDTLDRQPTSAEERGDASVLDSAAGQASADQAEPEAAVEAVPAAPPPAADPIPVAGLDQTQMNNALKIVKAGQALGLPARAYVIAVATSMQESNLRNLASTRIPESYEYNAEGEGSDHDSVGLFQQRASTGWGAVSQLMDPAYAASAFYQALMRVPGWEGMELTWAAQTVQVSAYPYAYAKHEPRAQEIVNALLAPAP